ncbi:MAG: YjdF family protein [Devosia sp.]
MTTIYHDGRFWVGLVERFGVGGNYACARHIFGPEPNNAELLNWASCGFAELVSIAASAPVAASDAGTLNPKRAHRAIAREMRAKPAETHAQQTIKDALSEHKVERCHRRAKRSADEIRIRFELRRSKRKRARRGR